MKDNKIANKNSSDSIEVVKMIKILVIVLAVFLALWLIIALVKGEIKLGKDKPIVTIQYEEILAGESFNQKENEYYVMFFDHTSSDAGIYGSLISKYEDLTIYRVDLNKGFNQNFMTTEISNKNPLTISDLKVNGPTLIKVVNKNVTNYIEGKENIKAYLSSIK